VQVSNIISDNDECFCRMMDQVADVNINQSVGKSFIVFSALFLLAGLI